MHGKSEIGKQKQAIKTRNLLWLLVLNKQLENLFHNCMIMRKQRRNGELKANIRKRILEGILVTALTVTALPSMALLTPTRAGAATVTLKNPRIVKDDSMDSGQKVTWDCIWFGSYPQREVVENANTYTAIDENYYNQQTDVIEDASLFKKL